MREPKPVTRVELSEKNNKLRWIAVIALLVIGAVGITTGIMSALGKDSGWQQVQAYTQERNCSDSILLRYNFTGSGAEASGRNKVLEQLYSDGCVKAYQLFTPDEGFDDVQNVYYVNHHPNEVIPVDPVLYAAFEKLEGTRHLYLGPAYAYYSSLIYSTEEAMLEQMDPSVSEEAKAYVAKIAEFAADESAVRLELLGNHQVKLHVSDAYLEFAETEEIDTFIDFAYMTNAFIVDYFAQLLTEKGLTQGYLVSADGFTRNLDSSNTFSFNIYDRVERTAYQAGVLHYNGPISMVFLKDYPTAASDVNYRRNGERYLNLFVDPADGICRTSVKNLVSYSYDGDCVDVMLRILPNFIGDSFTVPEGVFSVWCQDGVIYYNDEAVSIQKLLRDGDISYRAELEK